jgi:hypothetical protein
LARRRKAGPGANHRVYYADLSVLQQMKHVAGEIAAAEPQIECAVPKIVRDDYEPGLRPLLDGHVCPINR